jgi:SAM-dependent methyltransferase
MTSDDAHGHASGHPGGHPGSHASDAHPHAAFRHLYAGGAAPWDIGRPQPGMVALDDAGMFGPSVLDVGCGTGELSIFLASRGHAVVGVDAVPAPIEQARQKAEQRSVKATFVVADVLEVLARLDGRPFDAVVDVGFFHALGDEDRVTFARELADVMAAGGVYAMLCFSDRVPGQFGPRRISEADIRATFASPVFTVREVRPAELYSARPEMPVVDANLAIVERA